MRQKEYKNEELLPSNFNKIKLHLGMKKIFTIAFLAISSLVIGQNFHVTNPTTTLVKTTDQSPAHWYIEVYNDVNPDSLLLRWKASFSNIPSAWQINLDDQDNYTTDINDGDSSDFYLHADLSFPQKLIIGAVLNNTTGVGSVFFDLYEPSNPSTVVQIEYHFIVTQGTLGIVELSDDSWLTQKENIFIFNDDAIGHQLTIYSTEGKTLFSGIIEKEMNFEAIKNAGIVYFLQENKGEYKSAKFLLK